MCARVYARTGVRRGQTDRDKEHFRTRAGRDQGPRICCCWQGEAQENPRESHTWVPTLPLIRSLPFVSRSLSRSRSPSRESHRALPLSTWPLAISFSFLLYISLILPLSLSADYSPSLEYTISLFSLLPLSSPRTNGAHHLWPCHALRYPARATSVPFDRDEREPFKITCDCSFSKNEKINVILDKNK